MIATTPLKNRQQGMATLMFSVVLLIALTVITFLGAKTLLTEQAISANEYRAKEAGYAAEAALEYGIGWLDNNNPDFATWNASDEFGAADTWNDLSAANSSITAGTDTYALRVNYLRSCLAPVGTDDDTCEQWLIEIEAEAVAAADSDLKRRQWIRVLQSDMDDDGTPEYIRVPGSWRDWEVTP